MNRCLVFLASVLIALVAISSTANASPAEWSHAALSSDITQVASSSEGFSLLPSWATAQTPGLMAFVAIQL